MKTLALILGLLFTGFIATAQETEGVTITVTVENVGNADGEILAALHTEETFMKGMGIANFKKDAQKGKVTFEFKNVTPGIYAISTLHDANSNQRMDFEDSGIPKERYGMSGNEVPMGPPTFDGAKFEVTNEDLAFKIMF